MNFIELSDGLSVKVEDILTVKSNAEGGTDVLTSTGTYKCIFPYYTMLKLIGEDIPEEPKVVKLEPRAMSALEAGGHHFGG